MNLLSVVCAIAAAAWFLPLMEEHADSPCGALANLTINQKIHEEGSDQDPDHVGEGIARLFGGAVVARVMEQKFPDTPPQLSCVGAYWQAKIAPPRHTDPS